MRKEQYLLLTGGLIAVLLLFYLGKTKERPAETTTAAAVSGQFSDYEALQMRKVPEEDAATIRELKSAALLKPDAEAYLALSNAWENIGNYPLGAFYYREAVGRAADSLSWETAGDKLYNSYKNYSDTIITNNLITFALASYERAYIAEPGNLRIRMKLAETYVESPEPMKGILMLREITDSIPDYIPAQMTLGRLSLQTGQFDKALERFQKVLEESPGNTEALYFMALANEGLGRIDETIRLLELCKVLVDNPEFSREIDGYITRLQK